MVPGEMVSKICSQRKFFTSSITNLVSEKIFQVGKVVSIKSLVLEKIFLRRKNSTNPTLEKIATAHKNIYHADFFTNFVRSTLKC